VTVQGFCGGQHVGATAWLDLAENAVNPFRPTLYSPQLKPGSLGFGVQAIGTSSSKPVTLSNPGTGFLAVNSISIIGLNSGDFSTTSNCGSGLVAGASCQITVTFTPTAIGLRTALLRVTATASVSEASIVLSPVSLVGTGR
jgi:hypothetical protein